MKKLTSVLLSGVMAASMCATAAISASAEVTELPADWDPTQYSYTVVGDAGLLGDGAWQPENDDFNMSYDEAAGIWYLNLNGVGNGGDTFYYGAQYKVVVRNYDPTNPWEFSFNENGVAYGLDSNSIVDFGETAEEASVVTIMFDGEKASSRIDNPYAPATTEHTYFAVGDANLFNPAWTPNEAKYQLVKGEDGNYSVTIPVTEEQWENPFEYKVVQDGTWDVSFNDEGEATGEGTNAIGFIDENSEAVVITFDTTTQKTAFECVLATVVEPTEAPTAEPTEVVTDTATTATEVTTDAGTVANATENGTDTATTAATDATSATTATTATQAATSTSTNATGTAGTTSSNTTSTATGTVSSATGKVATGDSSSVAVLLGVIMLAGGAVVVARKRISE